MTLLSTSGGRWGTLQGETFQVQGTGRSFIDIAQSKNGNIFGISGSSLYRLNRSGESTFIGSLGISKSMNALGFDSNGVLFGTAARGFYRIDQGTGKATLIKRIPGFSSSGDIAFDPSRKRFFATSRTNPNSAFSDGLFSIDRKGNSKFVGSIRFRNLYGLTFRNGSLIGYTASNQEISINPNSGAGRLRRTIQLGASGIFGAA